MILSNNTNFGNLMSSKRLYLSVFILLLIIIAAISYQTQYKKEALSVIPAHQQNNPWYTAAKYKIANKAKLHPIKPVKNVILFVGDGMGVSTVTAARILEGQLKGLLGGGEENNLSFDEFPFTGLAKTYNVDAQTPDSAGTMTAMMSGVKTDACKNRVESMAFYQINF